MSSTEFFFSQCTNCGKMHKVNIKYRPRSDDIYMTLYCSECQAMTRQLDCGRDEEQLYEFIDINVDSRYYKYETK